MNDNFLDKAKENLKAAHLLFDNALYNATANRAYYAAFQAAIAALVAEGHTLHTSHETVQSTFNGELIRRRKVYPSDLSSYLSDLQIVRNQADYSTKQISQKVAARMLAKAENFVTTVARRLVNDEF